MNEFDEMLLDATNPKNRDSLMRYLRDGTYLQVSQLLKVDGSLYVYLHEDFQILADLAKLALESPMKLARESPTNWAPESRWKLARESPTN